MYLLKLLVNITVDVISNNPHFKVLFLGSSTTENSSLNLPLEKEISPLASTELSLKVTIVNLTFHFIIGRSLETLFLVKHKISLKYRIEHCMQKYVYPLTSDGTVLSSCFVGAQYSFSFSSFRSPTNWKNDLHWFE